MANNISTVHTLQALKGHKIPDLYNVSIKLHLWGLGNLSKEVKRRAKAMTPQFLYEIDKIVNFEDETQLVCFVALLVGFFLLLRKSNLIPDNLTGKKSFDPQKQFQRKDLRLGQRTILADIKWSKMQQKSGKALQLPLLLLVSKEICPIYWIKKMVRKVPGTGESPLFMVPGKSNRVALTYHKLSTQLKSWAEKIKGTKDGWTLHCLHRGGTTWCFNVDITSEAIRFMGDWASESYKKYLDMDVYKRAQTMQKFTANIDRLLFKIT